VHNSRPNRSTDRRIGLGISYIPTWARCTAKTRVSAMLVRGEDRHGNFDDERRPLVEARTSGHPTPRPSLPSVP
jgi:non-haem Fe2+, alpha-ketoglutarate-dependent halogenase